MSTLTIILRRYLYYKNRRKIIFMNARPWGRKELEYLMTWRLINYLHKENPITNDGIYFMKWMNRKIVLFGSNFHAPDIIRTVDWKMHDGTKHTIQCPQIVKDYNKTIYEINRNSGKCWHKIVWHFLDVAIYNLYWKGCWEKYEFENFPRCHPKWVSRNWREYVKEMRLINAAHMPLHGSSRRCTALCTNKVKQHRTKWSCSTSKKNCFVKFYNKD